MKQSKGTLPIGFVLFIIAITLLDGHRRHRRMADKVRLRLIALACFFAATPLQAQAARGDSAFTIGSCQPRTTDSTAWNRVENDPDVTARILPGATPIPPTHLRNRNGNFRGRIVISVVIDTTGWAVPGTATIEESTDSRLSEWGCKIASALRFRPATKAGRVVVSLGEQPFSYVFGDPPTD